MAEDEDALMSLRAATARSAANLASKSAPSDALPPRRYGRFTETGDEDVVEFGVVSPGGAPGEGAPASPRGAPVLRICDCRPFANAKANAIAGKGFETISRLGGEDSATLEFLDIANIHAMQASYKRLREASFAADDEDYFRAVHESGWVAHVSLVLKGAATVAAHSANGDPVLVHCSDGWDRTAQVAALAQILLDPYFRTVAGFGVLVEKDWCAFGHMFRERGGFGAVPSNETGPIFSQFLDAVSQLLRQFPRAFEFTDDLLAVLAAAARDRFFGTFLRDTDQDRRRDRDAVRDAADAPVSVWRVFAHQKRRFANALYDAGRDDRLLPRTRLADLRIGLAPAQPGSEVALLRARLAALDAPAAALPSPTPTPSLEEAFHDARDLYVSPPGSPGGSPA